MGIQQLTKAMEDVSSMQGGNMQDVLAWQTETGIATNATLTIVVGDVVALITPTDAYILEVSTNGKLLITGPQGRVAAYPVDKDTLELFDPHDHGGSSPPQQTYNVRRRKR